MFVSGQSAYAGLVFSILSFLVAIPSAVKVFNWTATLHKGAIELKTPMLYALGFIGLFTIGGLTGIMLAVFPFDYQAHDSYFVVAHMHYVLFGGTVFGVFSGVYYWFPKITGRMYDERLAQIHFWLLFLGFNLAFLPQHLLGLMGMQRRIYTYTQGGIFEWYNVISSVGALLMGVAMLVFLWNAVASWRTGRRVGPDPWGADTLEWYATSPPAPHGFDRVPYVTSARPLRDLRLRLQERET
jgi:cytochrome c oxidase subunit I